MKKHAHKTEDESTTQNVWENSPMDALYTSKVNEAINF